MNISTIDGTISSYSYVVPSAREIAAANAPPPPKEVPAPIPKKSGIDIMA